MAERDEDSNMELLIDIGDDRSVDSPDRRLSLKGSFQSDSLPPPDTDFMTDDRSSAASGLDVVDRLTYLEQRMQMQEDEIQLLKMALADVLKRLNITEEHQANAGAVRRAGLKARPVSLALSSRPAMKKSSTAPSAGPGRNYSPTPSSSSMRSPPGSVKDSPKARPGSAASARKPQDGSSKSKDAAVTLGTRKVTHCKVTMQIYLSPLARKTGCSEAAKSSATVTTKAKPNPSANTGASRTNASSNKTTNRPRAKTESMRGEKKKEKFTLNLQKTTSSTSQSAPQETSSYQSPVKSPSQYFQICY